MAAFDFTTKLQEFLLLSDDRRVRWLKEQDQKALKRFAGNLSRSVPEIFWSYLFELERLNEKIAKIFIKVKMDELIKTIKTFPEEDQREVLITCIETLDGKNPEMEMIT